MTWIRAWVEVPDYYVPALRVACGKCFAEGMTEHEYETHPCVVNAQKAKKSKRRERVKR